MNDRPRILVTKEMVARALDIWYQDPDWRTNPTLSPDSMARFITSCERDMEAALEAALELAAVP